MSNYKHGIRTSRQATQLATPVTSDGCLQCIIGTAPVNLAADPYDAVNKPFVAYKKADAISALGYSDDFKNYTLCQSVYATFDVFGVAPIVLINVLDPKKHVSAELSKTFDVVGGTAKVTETGILMDKLSVSDETGATSYKADEDYIASFNSDGTVSIAIVATGAAKSAKKLKVTYVQIDPSKVTYQDVIGSYDVSSKKKTGMELIGNVYPKYGIVPSLLLAPGWSHIPAVNLALNAKANLISSLFTAKVARYFSECRGCNR